MNLNQAQADYLNMLFDPEDMICFGSDPYSVDIKPLSNMLKTQYVALNPLVKSRADANVTKYRNILLEFDKHTIKEQLSFIKRNKIPYSTLVFSGSKSIHCIISLNEGLTDITAYRELVDQIYKVLDPSNKWLDKSCRNPSRFTRQAGIIRPSNGVTQELIGTVKERVNIEQLMAWTFRHKNWPKTFKDRRDKQLELNDRKSVRPNQTEGAVSNDRAQLTRRAEAFFEYGPADGENWRQGALFACCDAARCGYDVDEIYDMLLRVDGYLEADSENIPRDAWNMVANSGECGIRLA